MNNFIRIVDDDEAFEYRPVKDETGDAYDSVFKLRIVNDEVDTRLRKQFTKPVWDKKSRRPIDKLDGDAYADALLDYAIVDWSGITNARTGETLACTPDRKKRLPEKWKIEIVRLCAAKEAGDVLDHQEEEKKISKPS